MKLKPKKKGEECQTVLSTGNRINHLFVRYAKCFPRKNAKTFYAFKSERERILSENKA